MLGSPFFSPKKGNTIYFRYRKEKRSSEHLAELGGEHARDLLKGLAEIVLGMEIQLCRDLLDRKVGIAEKLHRSMDAQMVQIGDRRGVEMLFK